MSGEKRPKESDRHLETLLKGLEILNCLQGQPEMTVAEIANTLGIYKSRVMRLCGTLEFMGYLIYDERRRIYRLGPRVLSLARVYEISNPFIPVVRPVMESLYRELERTVSFAVPHGLGQLCAYRITEPRHFKEPSAYQETALFHGASARILLAFGSDIYRSDFFNGADSYPALTQYTITTREKLQEAIAKTQKQGYAITVDERVIGSIGIAVPVFQFSNALVGAISVSGRKEDFPEEFIERALTLLLQESGSLSRRFGYEASANNMPVS